MHRTPAPPAVLLAAALLGAGTACRTTTPPARGPVTWGEIAAQPLPPADHRVAYGPGPQQFGELRLPAGPGPHPVVVLVHGGCWQAEYDLKHVTPVAAALTRAGVATWTVEYRRLGDEGGGWPGTFLDVARATDHVRELAARFPLDTTRVVTAGHSAGGHLALWLAARPGLPEESPVSTPSPLRVRGVVALAPITDLRAYGAGTGSCNASVTPLLGGTPAQVEQRYALASPVERLPLGVPLRLVHGAADPIVPVAGARAFETRARAAGDDVRLEVVEGAGHFDVIAPFAPAWSAVERAVRELVAAR